MFATLLAELTRTGEHIWGSLQEDVPAQPEAQPRGRCSLRTLLQVLSLLKSRHLCETKQRDG